jgi:hypothetical protein
LSLDYGTIGVWLLVGGIIAIAVEGALAAMWAVRLSRRAQKLRERLLVEQGLLEADIARLRLALAETDVLWQPYGRLLRWLRHPIAIALLQSLMRRRAGAR